MRKNAPATRNLNVAMAIGERPSPRTCLTTTNELPQKTISSTIRNTWKGLIERVAMLGDIWGFVIKDRAWVRVSRGLKLRFISWKELFSLETQLYQGQPFLVRVSSKLSLHQKRLPTSQQLRRLREIS